MIAKAAQRHSETTYMLSQKGKRDPPLHTFSVKTHGYGQNSGLLRKLPNHTRDGLLILKCLGLICLWFVSVV